jgi:hypothetical protein
VPRLGVTAVADAGATTQVVIADATGPTARATFGLTRFIPG